MFVITLVALRMKGQACSQATCPGPLLLSCALGCGRPGPQHLERSKVLSRAGPCTHCSLSSASLAEHQSHVASPGQSFIPPGWPHPGSGRQRHPGDAELKTRVSCTHWCPSPALVCGCAAHTCTHLRPTSACARRTRSSQRLLRVG